MYLMSAPAANAFSPAPVNTTARTASSAASSRQTVSELAQRVDVERVERGLTIDRDDGDAVSQRYPGGIRPEPCLAETRRSHRSPHPV